MLCWLNAITYKAEVYELMYIPFIENGIDTLLLLASSVIGNRLFLLACEICGSYCYVFEVQPTSCSRV